MESGSENVGPFQNIFVSNILISGGLTHCELSGYQSFKKQNAKPRCILVRSFLSQPNDLQVICFMTENTGSSWH